MPKAGRYQSGGKFLDHTLFWTDGPFLGAGSADWTLAALEEAQMIASHQQDYAIAFGIPAAQIAFVEVPYHGSPELAKTLGVAYLALPKEDEPDRLMRLPVAPTPPPPPSDLAKALTLLAASPVIDAATKAALAALKVP